MKAISILQPFAWLIASGQLHEETRKWQTKYRGEIYIHASNKVSELHFELAIDEGHEFNPEDLEFGAIIGKAYLYDCVKHPDGFYIFKLREQQIIAPPIPAKGKLGIYDI